MPLKYAPFCWLWMYTSTSATPEAAEPGSAGCGFGSEKVPVATASGGRLIVSANRAASHPLREHLFALVGALTKALQGSNASVSLRFEAVSPGVATGHVTGHTRAGSRDSGAGSDR